MTKLCPRGKAAAKRKFAVYPSAYANAYASKICAGKIKDPSGVKRKDFRGKKAKGGLMEATARLKRQGLKSGELVAGTDNIGEFEKKIRMKKNQKVSGSKNLNLKNPKSNTRVKYKAMGGRINYRKGGGVCLRGMNRDAIGKNS